ncbi:hypothetical protein GP486_007194 [Trichoglossum hirsutum]|uniref:Uncharacterized protein n=1 Tax=Trichoglossum hirsutum TaxID=265104 RepID=A0A9P8IIF9_9PEZI|nr:hypothetical protein GP486_007194 [Trichoglossum hirsutum]
MANVSGTFESCGFGKFFSLQYTCAGPDCAFLNGMPNMTCSSSGGVLSCNNGVKCEGRTNYTSDFAYNEQDGLMKQSQHIKLAACGFTLVSQGSTQLPEIVNSTCSNATSLLAKSSASARSQSFGTKRLISILLVTILFIQTVMGLPPETPDNRRPYGEGQDHDLLVRSGPEVPAVIQGVKDYIYAYNEYLGGKISNIEEGKKPFAETLAHEIVKAVCDHYIYKSIDGVISKVLTIGEMDEAIQACTGVVYLLEIENPLLLVLSVVGAGALCNWLINAILPTVSGMTEDTCNTLESLFEPECGEDRLTDWRNCGSCGNVCESGACANGVCGSVACVESEGAQCGSSSPDCICSMSQSKAFFCLNDYVLCEDLIRDTCSSDEECKIGRVCAHSNNCNIKRCMPACSEGNATSLASPISSPPPTASPISHSTQSRVSQSTAHQSTTSQSTASHSTSSLATPPPSNLKPWVFRVASSSNGDSYEENPHDLDSKSSNYLLDSTISSSKTLNTVCVTFFNTGLHSSTTHVSENGDMDGLAKGDMIYFGYSDDSATTHDSCCLEYFANEDCNESGGEYKTFCGPGTHQLEYFTASWLVKGCKLLYSG